MITFLKKWRKQIGTAVLVFGVSFFLVGFDNGCDDTADQKITDAQAQAAGNMLQQTGMPTIVNFTEWKEMKRIYEEKDANKPTYTYTQDMNGKLWHICNSFGYPVPGGTEMTNPQKWVRDIGVDHQMPQSEPNQLFPPSSAEGTMVFCINPITGTTDVVYVEPKVITLPWKISNSGEYFPTK